VHEFIYEVFRFEEEQILSIQIDGYKKCVYVKLLAALLCEQILREYPDEIQFTDEYQTFKVKVELADKPITLVKLSVVPTELPHTDIYEVLSQYGIVKSIKGELFTAGHR